MENDMEEYVRNCDTFQSNKGSSHEKYRMLQQLEVLNTPCSSISMDFIVGLPGSEAHTLIGFIPLKTEATIKELAHIFLQEIWRLYRLSEEIIYDWDFRFESKFWHLLMKLFRVKQYFRNCCSYQQDNWAGLLPPAEYAYNMATQQSTKVSQSYVNYGFEPDSNWHSHTWKLDNVYVSSAVLESKWKVLWKTMRTDIFEGQAR
ncbi:uncharacterized protein H6S33_012711 [Morchella sextelata]|uniref:uncharacterized protein n=1 Tax=Morchella sextelata TaxID=1174677 RepID=UPI001D0381AE|nr:uncharacterized protein H6S33_012711 [Morchella sextelata]KAH0609225.1 hypothetical protein H6S33_012711 [Morchella sextelata]